MINKLKTVLNLLLKAFKLNKVSTDEDDKFNVRIPDNISLFNSDHPFYELLENVNLLVVFLDINGKVIYCNSYLLTLTGYKLEELIGSDWFGLMVPDSNPETKEVFLKGLKTGKIANHFENPILTKSGKQHLIFWNNTILKDTSGNVTGTASIGEDITDRKFFEEALLSTRENLEANEKIKSDLLFKLNEAQQSAKIGSWDWDMVTNKVWWSDELYRILELNPDNYIPSPASSANYVHPEDNIPYHTEVQRVIESKEELNYDLRIMTPAGKIKFCNSRAKLEFNKKGTPIRFHGTFSDITERKQTETALKESEERFRNAFENIPDVIVIYDKNLKIQHINATTLRITGRPVSDFIGQRDDEIWPAEVFGAYLPTLEKALKSGKICTVETKLMLTNIGTQYLRITCIPILDESGNVNEVMGITHDFTQRKQAEETIQSERDFSNALLDGLPGIFYFYNNDFKFLRWNKNFETVSGYSGNEIAKMEPLDFFSGSEKDLLKERISEVFTLGQSKVEADFVSKDGKRTPYFFNGFKINYDNMDCLIGIGIDITERIEAEKEVNSLITNLQNLADSVKKLSSARDFDSIVSIVKHSARALSGADGVTFVVREGDFCYYFDEDAIEPLWKGKKFPINNCVSGWAMLNNKPAIVEDIFSDPRVPAELYKPTFVKSLIMMPVNTYEPVGAIGHYWSYRNLPSDMEVQLLQTLADSAGRAIENVNLYSELEDKIKNRTQQLETANKELESFSYSISHDLRAPLRAIYGFSQILADRHKESLNEEGKQYMDYIVESSVRMEQLINDLLNYSRLGRKTVEIRPVSLKKIIDAIIDDFKPQIEEIGGKFQIADNPPVIPADESLLRQIFSNLVGNAIKYRNTDTALLINISFDTIQEGVLIKVADNGIGIPAEHCEKIFNVFQRLHGEDKYPGTGIGLANVKKAVALLGGSIYVESSVGKGSTFILELTKP